MTDSRSRTVNLSMASIVLALIGLGLSVYATVHQVEVKISGATDAFCNINATFNCDDIARSPYSELFGIPLGVYGAGFFLGILTLFGMTLFKEESTAENLQTATVLTAIGVVTSFVLAIISFGVLGKGCVVCMGIYGITVIQAIVLFAFRSTIPAGFNSKNLGNGGTYALCAVLVAVTAFNFLKPATPASPDVATNEGDDNHANEPPEQLSSEVVDIKIDKSDYSGFGQDYRAGSDDAKVVVVEFADFECPACKGAASAMKDLKREYGDRILVVFKNFPLDQECNAKITNKMHQYACSAARVARCVGKTGRFWDMYDHIYEKQAELNKDSLRRWAKEYGLTDQQVDECFASKDVLAKLEDDINAANKAGVDSTPTFFINGRKLQGGRTFQALKNAIDKQLLL